MVGYWKDGELHVGFDFDAPGDIQKKERFYYNIISVNIWV